MATVTMFNPEKVPEGLHLYMLAEVQIGYGQTERLFASKKAVLKALYEYLGEAYAEDVLIMAYRADEDGLLHAVYDSGYFAACDIAG